MFFLDVIKWLDMIILDNKEWLKLFLKWIDINERVPCFVLQWWNCSAPGKSRFVTINQSYNCNI